ncbi:MAG: hypothetical protein ACLP2Y_05620 [Limisphaerales bacterium]
MNKIPAREVQVFAAGAFALWGFRALIWLPSYFFVTTHNIIWVGRIAGSLLTAFALPLGVAILLGKTRAIRLTQIYLWLFLVFGVGSVISLFHDKIVIGAPILWYTVLKIVGATAPDMIVIIVLLWLLCSRRFRHEPVA